MPNQPKTPLRSFRISEELWQKAKAAAERKGLTVTDVVRKALEDLTDDPQ